MAGAHYATGDQWRNNSRNNDEIEPKQNQHPAVDMTDVDMDVDMTGNKVQ